MYESLKEVKCKIAEMSKEYLKAMERMEELKAEGEELLLAQEILEVIPRILAGREAVDLHTKEMNFDAALKETQHLIDLLKENIYDSVRDHSTSSSINASQASFRPCEIPVFAKLTKEMEEHRVALVKCIQDRELISSSSTSSFQNANLSDVSKS